MLIYGMNRTASLRARVKRVGALTSKSHRTRPRHSFLDFVATDIAVGVLPVRRIIALAKYGHINATIPIPKITLLKISMDILYGGCVCKINNQA